MPADANIFQQYLQAPKSIVDYTAQYDQADARKNALEMAAMDLSEKRQASQRAQTVRNSLMALGAGATDEARINALRATATPEGFSQADALEKAILERQKTGAQVKKDTSQAAHFDSQTDAEKLKTRIAKSNQAIKDIASFQTPQQALASLEQHAAAGDIDPQQAAMVRQTIPANQADFPKWQLGMVQRIMEAKDRMEYMAPTANTLANNQTSIATNAATNATSRANNRDTIAGENERSRLTREAGKLQFDSERGGVVNLTTGEFKPATQGGQPIPGKDKPLNDSQAKANLFGTRMQEADKVLGKMAERGVLRPGVIKGVAESVGNIAGLGTESMGGALGDAAGSLTNFTQSAEQQQVEQAQRDFINAALRRESGASISPSEFRNANKQYFPQPNDDQETLALKARNRKIATEGILAEVPEGKRMKAPAAASPVTFDGDKERRYQEWKARQAKGGQ